MMPPQHMPKVWGDSTYVARRISKKPHQLIDFLLFFGIIEKTAFVTSKNKQQQMYKTNDANLKRKTNIVLDRLVSEKRYENRTLEDEFMEYRRKNSLNGTCVNDNT
jgi:hypothetical protein